jgi:hypothetical protein
MPVHVFHRGKSRQGGRMNAAGASRLPLQGGGWEGDGVVSSVLPTTSPHPHPGPPLEGMGIYTACFLLPRHCEGRRPVAIQRAARIGWGEQSEPQHCHLSPATTLASTSVVLRYFMGRSSGLFVGVRFAHPNLCGFSHECRRRFAPPPSSIGIYTASVALPRRLDKPRSGAVQRS